MRPLDPRPQIGDELFRGVLRWRNDEDRRSPGALADAGVTHTANLLDDAGEQRAVEGASLSSRETFAGLAAVLEEADRGEAERGRCGGGDDSVARQRRAP